MPFGHAIPDFLGLTGRFRPFPQRFGAHVACGSETAFARDVLCQLGDKIEDVEDPEVAAGTCAEVFCRGSGNPA